MKRGKRILKMVWEDLWVGLGLVLVLCAAQFFRSSQWDLARLKELMGSSFPGSLILVSAVTLTLMIYSRYSVYEPLNIFMGYTRKNVFWDMQLVKLLSAFFAALISGGALVLGGWPLAAWEDLSLVFWGFVLMLLTQGVEELLTILYLKTRKQWIALIAIVAACAAIGGFVGYSAMAVIDGKGLIEIRISFLFLQENPLLWLVFFAAVYCLMGYFSWKLLKNLEVRI